MARPLAALGDWLPTPFLKLSGAAHVAAIGGLALAPQHWPWAAGGLVFNHVLIAGGGLWPRAAWLGPNLRRLSGAPADAVALTFDDGPHPDVTPRVLDLLDTADQRATFFCVGRRVERHPRIAADIAARGHRVENHSHSHRHTFSLLGPGGLGQEIDRGQEAIRAATGRTPVYFRAPAGLRNLCLEPLLARRRLRLVSWTRRPFDTVTGSAGRVASRLLDGLAPREILLMHDAPGVRENAADAVVLRALPTVLEGLRERGLRSVAIPDPGATG